MKSCLIVEDNPVVRGIIVEILHDLAITPIEVENADAGVLYCVDSKPDVVLLDWDLPSMAALDFLRGVGELSQDQRPEIILSATENDPRQFSLASAAGARHHILKPFDKPLLAAKLSEMGILDAQEGSSEINSESGDLEQSA